MIRPNRFTLDLKTISTKQWSDGAIAYSEHPTTHLLYVCYHLPAWDQGRLGIWYPDGVVEGLPEPSGDDLSELFDQLDGEEPAWVENVWETDWLWRVHLESKCGWPEVLVERWRTNLDVFHEAEEWVPLHRLTLPKTAINLAISLENRGIVLKERQDELVVSGDVDALTPHDIRGLIDYYRHLVAIARYTAKPLPRVGNLTHGRRPAAD